jgi:hypothetical protein
MILLEGLGLNLRKLMALRLVVLMIFVNLPTFAQIDYQADYQIDYQIDYQVDDQVVLPKVGEVKLQPSGDKGAPQPTIEVVNSASQESISENLEQSNESVDADNNVQIEVEAVDQGIVKDEAEQSIAPSSLDASDNSAGSGGQSLTQDFENYEGKRKSFGVHYRYLGVLSQLGVEKSLAGRFSMALYYGRYVGTVAGTDDLGFIPDLHHMALQTNIYLGREGLALSQGPVIRFAVHANQQKENELVKSVQVDGVDVIVPGQTRFGTLLGLGYSWQKKWFNVSVGAEYLSLGPLKNLVPLTVSLGVAF